MAVRFLFLMILLSACLTVTVVPSPQQVCFRRLLNAIREISKKVEIKGMINKEHIEKPPKEMLDRIRDIPGHRQMLLILLKNAVKKFCREREKGWDAVDVLGTYHNLLHILNITAELGMAEAAHILEPVFALRQYASDFCTISLLLYKAVKKAQSPHAEEDLLERMLR